VAIKQERGGGAAVVALSDISMANGFE